MPERKIAGLQDLITQYQEAPSEIQRELVLKRIQTAIANMLTVSKIENFEFKLVETESGTRVRITYDLH